MTKPKTPTNPKTPLRNARQEKFARGLARGLSATKAYMKAYGARGRNAETSGSRLRKNIEVAARIDELRRAVSERVNEKSAVEITDVIAELVKIGFANMKNYLKVTPAGDAYIDLSQLTPEQAAAIGEITIEDFKDGRGKNAREVRRTKFKLHDKRAALVDIGKHLGGFVERKELGGPGQFDRMSTDEIRTKVEERVLQRAKELVASRRAAKAAR